MVRLTIIAWLRPTGCCQMRDFVLIGKGTMDSFGQPVKCLGTYLSTEYLERSCQLEAEQGFRSPATPRTAAKHENYLLDASRGTG